MLINGPTIDVPSGPPIVRPTVRGRFLWVGNRKLYVRGVTYGTFRPGRHGEEYDPTVVERDFAAMAANGINSVRVYTVPPRWLLDAAARYGLWVMVGLPWEQHVATLDDRRHRRSIEARVRAGVRACAGHPAVLCYAVGNEIPAPIVRWHGARRIERFLARLCRAVKAEDPAALVTYVNYPSTEYLRLDAVDFVCFNVYLESPDRMEAYLARLHHLAGERPLLLAEIGLDSRRHGEEAQAESLDRQVRTAFAAGCTGAVVFAWTDEWHRGGYDVEDWDFGLTRRDRRPKPALAAVRDAFAEVPFPRDFPWPRVSVVVCTHNGARTIRDCLEGLRELDYPDFETIVVDDGSTDATAEIVAAYDVRLIRTENRGLSSARNTGMEHATGEIVAYTDDDARPDPHWLTYLAATFVTTDHAGVGGPNIAPPGDGPIAACVANAPGNPVQVLLTDRVAEHIAGCNSAFRRGALQAIGGYDPRFRVAGDDVDVCWRLQERGWTIGFNPAAMVWHHRRNSLRAYWRQQIGYGRAEALLEAKWPEKYNAVGHLTWAGRLYGAGLTEALRRRQRIYHGTWGSAPFQTAQVPEVGVLASLPLMPEWFLVIVILAMGSLLGLLWRPLLLTVPALVVATGAVLAQAALSGARATFAVAPRSRAEAWRRRALTAFLHLLQPLARLRGRQRHGLTPWRQRGARRLMLPRPRSIAIWSERWREPAAWLEAIEARLRQEGAVILRGGSFDRWDLACRGGLLGASRLRLAVEEHGSGKQYARIRWWPRCSRWSLAVPVLLGLLVFLAYEESKLVSALLGLGVLAHLLRLVAECATATAAFRAATGAVRQEERALDPVGRDLPLDVATEPADEVEAMALFTRRRRTHARAAEAPTATSAADQSARTNARLNAKRTFHYAKPYWNLVVCSVTLVFLGAAASLLQPWPLKILVDNVLGGHPLGGFVGVWLGEIADGRYSLLTFAVLGGLGVTLLIHGLSIAENYVNTKLEQLMVLDFRSDLFRHAQGLSLAFHDQKRTGNLMFTINNSAGAVGSIFTTVPALAQSAITLIGMFWVALRINVQLALLSMIVAPFLTCAIRYYMKRIEPRLYQVREMEGESLSIVHEAMAMLRVIVAFGREDHEYRRFRNQGEEAVDARVKLTVRQTLFSLAVNTTTAAGNALVLGVGAVYVLRGHLTVGDLLVIISYVQSMYQPLESISTTAGSLQEQFVRLRAAFGILDTPPEVQDAPDAVALDRAHGNVAFEGICFTYRGRKDTLKDISFDARAGEVICIVGPTGAGKSTLVSLLPRFYDPKRGRILLDGRDIRGLELRSLRRQISIVLQEPLLFAGSIAENIRYGRLEASDDEVVAAATFANAHDFISRLPTGYETKIGERGAQLSGGERQRIAVARAFLKDAPILILDEPTSSIDSKTEAVILDALDRLMQGRTTFMIAHRLSTIRNADKILVINQGELVEAGTHDELLLRDGLYRQLHEMQMASPRSRRESVLVTANGV